VLLPSYGEAEIEAEGSAFTPIRRKQLDSGGGAAATDHCPTVLHLWTKPATARVIFFAFCQARRLLRTTLDRQ